MILPIELDELERTLLNIDEQDLRKVCAFCRMDLPGSDPFGRRITHGVCSPRCGPARALGWEDEPVSVLVDGVADRAYEAYEI
jgi:hypothetical protein